MFMCFETSVECMDACFGSDRLFVSDGFIDSWIRLGVICWFAWNWLCRGDTHLPLYSMLLSRCPVVLMHRCALGGSSYPSFTTISRSDGRPEMCTFVMPGIWKNRVTLTQVGQNTSIKTKWRWRLSADMVEANVLFLL